MAITTASQLQALLPYRRLVLLDKTTNSTQPGAGNWGSHWTSAGGSPAGATPTAAAVCDNTTPGALSMPSPGAGETLYLCSVERATLGLNGFAPVSHLIYDRLVHSGGLSAVVTTAQAVNTPALTRYTDGIGVFPYLEVYATLGGTITTALVDYTNDAGVAKQTTVSLGGSANQAVSNMVRIPLNAGDLGVRSVEQVTLAGSTVVAGNFGVTLARHHCWFPLGSGRGNDARSYDWMDLGLPIIEANACLALASSIASGASRYGVNCNLGFLSA